MGETMNIRLGEWSMPDSYFGATREGCYVFLSQHRDSDTLERSNFRSALEAIGGESVSEGGARVVREGHWAVGWVEWIAIPFGPSVALAKANEIMEGLEGYPVVDEEDWSELEQDDANEVWSKCYDWHERLEYVRERPDEFYFNSFSGMMSCIRGEYFKGYASELLS
jgi:hypothetical protein